MISYPSFLESKIRSHIESGFDVDELPDFLFDFQKDIVRWSLKKGRCAIFAGTGLGKTAMQLTWANEVCKYTGGKVLILTPLAVAKQTFNEGMKFGIKTNICRTQADVTDGISICNYEMLHHFNADEFVGVVLDESSILKNYSGHMRNLLIDTFINTPYRLACSATPSPNDYTEMGNHAEFLSIMNRTEMLSMFFYHDGGNTQVWEIKRHAVKEYWRWVASWATMLQNPSDLGYDGELFKLPPLNIKKIAVTPEKTSFFYKKAVSLNDRKEARKESIPDRVKAAAELVNNSDEQWLIWCNLNEESKALVSAIPGAVEIEGADKPEYKEQEMINFSEGKTRVLVTKPKIAGFGMNWQLCHNMIFVGLSDSFEQLYQATRRCWRFGQMQPVNVYHIVSVHEGPVVATIKRKEDDFSKMLSGMIAATQELCSANIKGTTHEKSYCPEMAMKLPAFIGGVEA
jgi:hypothetical protein